MSVDNQFPSINAFRWSIFLYNGIVREDNCYIDTMIKIKNGGLNINAGEILQEFVNKWKSRINKNLFQI